MDPEQECGKFPYILSYGKEMFPYLTTILKMYMAFPERNSAKLPIIKTHFNQLC